MIICVPSFDAFLLAASKAISAQPRSSGQWNCCTWRCPLPFLFTKIYCGRGNSASRVGIQFNFRVAAFVLQFGPTTSEKYYNYRYMCYSATV